MRSPSARFRLSLLGGFDLHRDAERVPLSEVSQRLIALLALNSRPVRRDILARVLWPKAIGDHAVSSLRTAVSRLGSARDSVEILPRELCLAASVAVDVDGARALALGLLDTANPPSAADLWPGTLGSLSSDLLPGWHDAWLVDERENWRQLRMHALDALAERLIEEGRFREAAATAFASVKADPLRESGRAALIRAHLAEGNIPEAIREFDAFRWQLRAEAGLEPSPDLRSLIDLSGGET